MKKILDFIADKVENKVTTSDKKRIKLFPKVKERMVKKMLRDGTLTSKKMALHKILITFFGCGKWPHGPGTFASFMTVLMWFGMSLLFYKLEFADNYELIFWLIICGLIFAYGVLVIPLYSKYVDREDHPSIVIDEVVGQLLALSLTYPFVKIYYFDESWFLSRLSMFAHMFSSFVFFRFLDIAKPSFIGTIDRNMKNSFGVMFDDVVCGLVTAVINITIFLVYESAIIRLHGG